jgi:phosphatidylglycerol:prolipoprotein diacylglycerol transferase
VQPELHAGPLTFKTFGISFALAFVAIGLVLARRLRELDRPVDWAYEMTFAALIGGIVGARGYYVAQHWDEVRDDLIGNVLGGAGLVWYGGLLGGAVAILLWARWRGMLGLGLLDLCAPALALGYAIGRVGCQLSGDGDYGKASDLPWAMAYPDGEAPTSQEVQPTPIYESLAMGLVAWGLWRLRNSFCPGVLFALYLVSAGVERFLVEFLRRNPDALAGLTAPQLQSLFLIAGGIAWLVVAVRRGGRRPGGGTAIRPAPA